MGGQAFLKHNPPLPTPRMPLHIYTQVLQDVLALLRSHYTHADSPIEAPGKESYGDVDILVTGPLNPSLDPALTSRVSVGESLQKILNASAFITEKGNPTVNLAVPWPSSEPPLLADSPRAASTEFDGEDKYIQIDIHFLATHEQYTWELFHSAHGDLWNILGTTIRPYGLTVNSIGLHLRIPSIELLDRKKSHVFLTSTPTQVLTFLGLDESRWWSQFSSQEEMFEYAAGCRCFWVKKLEDDEDDATTATTAPISNATALTATTTTTTKADVTAGIGDVVGEVTSQRDQTAQEGSAPGKKKLKHNDRQRMSKRPIFAHWIENFIPQARAQGRFTTCQITREQIRDEAFAFFGVQDEYLRREHEWQRERHRDELSRTIIKNGVPLEGVDPQRRAAAVRTLKAGIMDGEVIAGFDVPAEVQMRPDGFWDFQAVSAFVERRWEVAAEVGWARMMAQVREKNAAKEVKRKREAEEKVEEERRKTNADVLKGQAIVGGYAADAVVAEAIVVNIEDVKTA